MLAPVPKQKNKISKKKNWTGRNKMEEARKFLDGLRPTLKFFAFRPAACCLLLPARASSSQLSPFSSDRSRAMAAGKGRRSSLTNGTASSRAAGTNGKATAMGAAGPGQAQASTSSSDPLLVSGPLPTLLYICRPALPSLTSFPLPTGLTGRARRGIHQPPQADPAQVLPRRRG